MTPLLRRRLKEKFPRLRDSDLPREVLGEDELVERIVRRTGRVRERVRQILYEIGVFVPPRVPVVEMHPPKTQEESLGSGVPDDTGQSGMMSMGQGW